MASGGMTVNGTDLETLGVTVRSATGRRDGLSFGDPERPTPRSMGRLLPKRRGEATPRVIDVRGHQVGTDLADLRKNLRDLRALLTGGYQSGDPLEVSFADDPNRIFYALLDRMRPRALDPALTSPKQQLEIRLRCDDPLLYDASLSTVDFSTGQPDVPLGSGPSAPIITLTGPATDPTVTFRDSSGSVVATIGLTVTLASGEKAIIDCRKHYVTDPSDTNHLNDWWTSGQFFEMDGSAHGGGEDGPYPTLEVDVSVGSAIAEYRKSWA